MLSQNLQVPLHGLKQPEGKIKPEKTAACVNCVLGELPCRKDLGHPSKLSLCYWVKQENMLGYLSLLKYSFLFLLSLLLFGCLSELASLLAPALCSSSC